MSSEGIDEGAAVGAPLSTPPFATSSAPSSADSFWSSRHCWSVKGQFDPVVAMTVTGVPSEGITEKVEGAIDGDGEAVGVICSCRAGRSREMSSLRRATPSTSAQQFTT